MTIAARASVNGGADQSGKITIVDGDVVQPKLADTSSIGTVLWEIVAFPSGFSTPSGWTAATGRFYWQGSAATGFEPPAIDFTGAPWGMYWFRPTVDNGIDGSAIDLEETRDATLAVEILGPGGLRDVPVTDNSLAIPGETFRLIWGAIQANLRLIGAGTIPAAASTYEVTTNGDVSLDIADGDFFWVGNSTISNNRNWTLPSSGVSEGQKVTVHSLETTWAVTILGSNEITDPTITRATGRDHTLVFRRKSGVWELESRGRSGPALNLEAGGIVNAGTIDAGLVQVGGNAPSTAGVNLSNGGSIQGKDAGGTERRLMKVDPTTGATMLGATDGSGTVNCQGNALSNFKNADSALFALGTGSAFYTMWSSGTLSSLITEGRARRIGFRLGWRVNGSTVLDTLDMEFDICRDGASSYRSTDKQTGVAGASNATISGTTAVGALSAQALNWELRYSAGSAIFVVQQDAATDREVQVVAWVADQMGNT